MPSTSAKQHRFMQAVAHSPSFAKKAGVSQSVGKDFSAADKGKTFSKGGTMKIRKFADAGYVDGEDGNQYRDYDPDKTYSGRFTDDETGGLAENTPTRAYKPEKRETEDTPAPTARARAAAPAASARAAAPAASETAPKAAPEAARLTGLQKETNRRAQAAVSAAPKKEAAEDKSSPRTTAQQGRYGKTDNKTRGKLYLRGTPEEQEAEAEKRMDVVMAAMPLGKLGLVGKTVGKPALQTIERQLLTGPARTGQYLPAPRTARLEAPRARLSSPRAAEETRMARATSKYNEGRTQTAQDAWKKANPNDRNANLLAKGGAIMESKKMVGKEVAFMKKKGAPASMIKHEKAEMGMKKGGMPMKDGKPAFMKKMMGGGMAYAKGGGIESRGKTKGTVIRMAAGGSVSRRADGIAQRGKTKFTNY